ncbi:hypothetical protein N7527_008729 [Penicillium freii]|nr:hypothetical protein N7527_008729 [Penicillium freii]
MPTKIPLKDPSLRIGQNYIDGKWLEAESGKRFNVTAGRNRSRILRRWYELVMGNQEDLATLIT